MRRPILKDIVNNFEKGTKGSISTERVHDGLAFIIESREEDPRETKKENEAVEKQKRSRRARFSIIISLIKPEDLEEGDEWDEGIIYIEG
jgi:hypothetical protein